MRVKVTFSNGTSMIGTLPKDEYISSLNHSQIIPWIMNDDRQFVPFIQPNGKEVQLSKNAIAYIVEEDDEELQRQVVCGVLARFNCWYYYWVLVRLIMDITDKARERLNYFLDQRGKGGGVFVTVKTTGCSGYAYHLEFASYQDSLIEVDAQYQHMFEGVTLDYTKKGLNEGFEFDNPNEKAKCGCGESFTV